MKEKKSTKKSFRSVGIWVLTALILTGSIAVYAQVTTNGSIWDLFFYEPSDSNGCWNGTTCTQSSYYRLHGNNIKDGTIWSAEVTNNSLTTDDIATNGVWSAEITDWSVGVNEIATNGVWSAEIIDWAVGGAEIATNAVWAAEISAWAVGSSEVANNSLTSDDLWTNSVWVDEIWDNAVWSAEISEWAVGSSEIATNAVWTAEISEWAVGGSEIATSAVWADEIWVNAVWSSELQNTWDFTMNSLTATADVTAGGIYKYSDKNLKENIIKLLNSLDSIDQLNGYSYNLKENGKPSIWVIAQEVEKVFPELVKENVEGIKSVDYEWLIAVLIEAVKDLNDRNIQTESQFDSINERIQKLEEKTQ